VSRDGHPSGASVTASKGARTVLHSRVATGTWGTAEEIPGTAGLNAGGNDELDDISCASPGNCSGGGVYADAAGNQELYVVDESNGTWGTAVEIPGFALLNAGTKANFFGISCSSAGNCGAVGSYTDESGRTQAFVVTETSGTWGSAIEAPGIPFLNYGGSLATAVSCPSNGNCSAGGTYLDATDHLQAFAINETSGSWGTAIAIRASWPSTPAASPRSLACRARQRETALRRAPTPTVVRTIRRSLSTRPAGRGELRRLYRAVRAGRVDTRRHLVFLSGQLWCRWRLYRLRVTQPGLRCQ